MKKLSENTEAERWQLVAYETATIERSNGRDEITLTVKGAKPYMNMKVALSPVQYIMRPDYWIINVGGHVPSIGLPAQEPYDVSMPINGVLGTRGIEVVGSNKSEKIDVLWSQ